MSINKCPNSQELAVCLLVCLFVCSGKMPSIVESWTLGNDLSRFIIPRFETVEPRLYRGQCRSMGNFVDQTLPSIRGHIRV